MRSQHDIHEVTLSLVRRKGSQLRSDHVGGAWEEGRQLSPIFRSLKTQALSLSLEVYFLPALFLCLSLQVPREGSRAWSRGNLGAVILSTGLRPSTVGLVACRFSYEITPDLGKSRPHRRIVWSRLAGKTWCFNVFQMILTCWRP